MKNNAIVLAVLAIVLMSCQRDQKKKVTATQLKEYKEKLVSIHKEVVRIQADSIGRFIKDNGWQMTQSKTGLWSEIIEDQPGRLITSGDEVYLNYSAALLNGPICYTSDSLGLKNFIIGRGGVEAGLEEAMLLLSEGDSARLILPSYLAHGVAGDQNRIPRLSIVLYTVKVVGVISD